MMMRLTILVLILFAIPVVAQSAVIEVPKDYTTIQAAIDAALKGDTVLVSPGTYVENIDFKGKTIVVISSDGPDVTIIDGNKSSSVVTFESGEDLNSVLDGFTVTNGSGTPDPKRVLQLVGGGIFCYMSSPTIVNNIITKNDADGAGGIICYCNSNAKIHNNIISHNLAFGTIPMNTGGGGIGVGWDSSPEIVNNFITENTASGNGGGINISANFNTVNFIIRNNTISNNSADCEGGISVGYSDNGIIENNFISGNSSINNGGGIGCMHANDLFISNNIICENYTYYSGGGISCNLSEVILTNNTIFGNTAAVDAGGILAEYSSIVKVVNTILWNNSAPIGNEISIQDYSDLTISFSNVDGGLLSVDVNVNCTCNWWSGMIDADPQFMNSAVHDFHIFHTSPCRNTGDDETYTLPEGDFEDDPRIANDYIDMGADEFYTHLYYTGNATPGGSIGLNFIGVPNTTTVILWVGAVILDPPYHSKKYGNFYIQPPFFQIPLVFIIPPTGILSVPYKFAANFPVIDIPMQAMIGNKLTNLCVIPLK